MMKLVIGGVLFNKKGILLYRMLSGSLPFYIKNKSEAILKLQNSKIEMKSYFSEAAASLLNGLLTIDVINYNLE